MLDAQAGIYSAEFETDGCRCTSSDPSGTVFLRVLPTETLFLKDFNSTLHCDRENVGMFEGASLP